MPDSWHPRVLSREKDWGGLCRAFRPSNGETTGDCRCQVGRVTERGFSVSMTRRVSDRPRPAASRAAALEHFKMQPPSNPTPKPLCIIPQLAPVDSTDRL